LHHAATFAEGSYGHSLRPGIEALPDDLKVNKTRFGAFVPGSSELHGILKRVTSTQSLSLERRPMCAENPPRAMQ